MREFGYYWVRSKIDTDIVERDELKDPLHPWEVMYLGTAGGPDDPIGWFSMGNELYSDPGKEDWIGVLGPRIEPPQ